MPQQGEEPSSAAPIPAGTITSQHGSPGITSSQPIPFCYSLWKANTTHQGILCCPGELGGILGSSGSQSWPSPGSPSHCWALQEAKSPRGLCSSSFLALAQLPRLYPAHRDLGSSPTSSAHVGNSMQTPMPPCPTPIPPVPVAGIQGRHHTCTGSLGVTHTLLTSQFPATARDDAFVPGTDCSG